MGASSNKKGEQSSPFFTFKQTYLQEDGAHLALLDVQAHDVTALPESAGLNVTLKSLAARIEPVTAITPVDALTVIPVARPVATNPVAHVSRL